MPLRPCAPLPLCSAFTMPLCLCATGPLDFCASEPLPLCATGPLDFCASEPLPLCATGPLDFCASEPLPLCATGPLDFCASEPLPLCASLLCSCSGRRSRPAPGSPGPPQGGQGGGWGLSRVRHRRSLPGGGAGPLRSEGGLPLRAPRDQGAGEGGTCNGRGSAEARGGEGERSSVTVSACARDATVLEQWYYTLIAEWYTVYSSSVLYCQLLQYSVLLPAYGLSGRREHQGCWHR